MRTISKRQRQPEKEERSTYLCKEVDPNYLGREIYADNVDTPYSFYLVRKLSLAKDYQNLAEGEAFFDAICDSWDATEEFEELVVKKIYMYVETEIMYYTLMMGSFEPTRRVLRMNLKKWFEEITLEKQERSLAYKGDSGLNAGEIQGMMKQMLETSNEIFRLRKMITDLTETINHAKIDMYTAKKDPIISRSIQTIHLKRAQPLVIEENQAENLTGKVSDVEESVDLEAELVDSVEQDETIATEQVDQQEAVGEVAEKKSEKELAEKPIQEDFQVEEERITSQTKESENKERPKKERTSIKLKRKQMAEEAVKSVVEPDGTEERNQEAVKVEPLDLALLVFKKRRTKKATPSNWPRFSKQLKASKTFEAPAKIPNFSKSEMENLEDEIYLCFMNKRMRLGTKKNAAQKKSVLRSDLLAQISQAEYLNYSWGQVLRQRKEDVLICGRLSCGGLVSSLDGFLQEMRGIAYSRSLFGKKVRCSVDLLRRLEGYILMDQYMQNLSLMPVEK
ncbi:hypothetical protein [Enterococcus caccae]|uniref:Uncharacterized protein n=1 Tax=Enterococcus caccae ATCC BAA-1240 TaxID=1158612 RepID=R3TWA0_9ENTE|nr:hypothetical protein [Enterococcus caccae]EOL45874.1 hypothetical protein UC7_01671 [Enterococcus caccae ATCC BAA-1240]EOT61070.1 hypothetical protein I580_01972 [Enterococcus caccae ATCC BAA-1240]OJG27899.1 hypothetical protein RU98_GL002108 [Enterococcus caccae]